MLYIEFYHVSHPTTTCQGACWTRRDLPGHNTTWSSPQSARSLQQFCSWPWEECEVPSGKVRYAWYIEIVEDDTQKIMFILKYFKIFWMEIGLLNLKSEIYRDPPGFCHLTPVLKGFCGRQLACCWSGIWMVISTLNPWHSCLWEKKKKQGLKENTRSY